ncbi:MAG: DNA gyrase C-terminal beta-propeller domain-containing protein [Caldilineaceae bacterium]
MTLERPDLTAVAPNIVAYIEALEEALENLRAEAEQTTRSDVALEPSEPPTTLNVISVSAAGIGKRTPRHYYSRQRRGGMGIFDLDSDADDPPAFLTVADESVGLILITNQGRACRIEVSAISERAVRDRGEPLLEDLPLRPDERLAVVAPDQGGAYLALASERGQVRRIGSQYLGKSLQPGTLLYNINEGGAPVAACWTSGNDEIFIATRQGKAIRFTERQVPIRGCLGMRVDPGDSVVGIAATAETGGIFMLTDDGKGTIRLLSGFSANKAPGSSGKVAMKSDLLVGANAVTENADIFVISQLGKLIRFRADEVPAKEGVVQGVNCMNLRNDACVAFAISPAT